MKKVLVFVCIMSLIAMAQSSEAFELLTNGSFETGDFTGWVTQDLSNPFWPLHVGGAGESPWGPFFSSAPTDGSFAALHGFDGNGPGSIRIAQDVDISSGFTEAQLSFDYRAAWNLENFGAQAARLFDVTIETSGGGAPLLGQNILMALPGTTVNDTGDLSAVIDLSAFAGQSIRVSFDFFIPESFSGPAQFQLDNISLNAVPEPTTLLLLGVGLLGLMGLGRKKFKK